MNIKLTKEQQQYVVAGVLFLGGGSFAYIKYFWMPISAEVKKTAAEIEEVEKKIAKAKVNAGKLKKIQQELEILNKKAEEAEKRLPKEEDFPSVVDTITDLAKKYGIELRNFSTGTAADKQHFIEISYKLTGSGGYHDLGRFFASLALEERIYNVQDVQFAPSGDTVNVTFVLLTYKYKG